MGNIAEQIRRWDEQYNDLPRKLQLIVTVLFTAFLLLKVLPYLWPFLLGLMFAFLMRPLVNFFAKWFGKFKKPRTFATLLAMVVVYGIIIWLLTVFFQQIILEGQRLASNVPSLIGWVQRTLKEWVERFVPAQLEAQQEALNAQIDQITTEIMGYLQGLITKVTPVVASGAWTTVTRIPHSILFVVMTIMSSFYFASDGACIKKFIVRQLPKAIMDRVDALRRHIGHAVLQQIKAQILVSCTVMASLVIGFFLFGIDYALLLGVVIGFLDVLPIIGAGTFLIPWSLFNLFAGNFPMGIKLAVMYLIVIVVRQIVEPRIVGKKLGLYPLVSMVSMYVGLKAMGFIGLIVAPIAANICKGVLETDAAIRREQRLATGGGLKKE